MRKQLILLGSLLSLPAFSYTANAAPLELTTFSAVQDAISNGQKLNFVVELSKCTDANRKLDTDDLVASFTPNEVMNIKNKYITASNLHFTMNSPQHKQSPVYEHIKYKLNTSGKLEISVYNLSVLTMDTLSYQEDITCTLGSGVRVFGLE